jgi:murein peptide amidase A
MAYTGVTLDVPETLNRLYDAAKGNGFTTRALVEQAGTIIPLFTKSAENTDAPRVYISTGVHGDEPAGPLAVLDLLESQQFCASIDWTLFPMMNPAGLRLNQRENDEGVDLNRDYTNPISREIKAHLEFIEKSEPWDLAMLVHEDWESEGFYLYDKPTALTHDWAEKIINAVSRNCPIDRNSMIDGMKAEDGIIRPSFADVDLDPKLRGQYPEAIYMVKAGKALGSFTLEAPSAYDLTTRMNALKTAILTGITLLKQSRA